MTKPKPPKKPSKAQKPTGPGRPRKRGKPSATTAYMREYRLKKKLEEAQLLAKAGALGEGGFVEGDSNALLEAAKAAKVKAKKHASQSVSAKAQQYYVQLQQINKSPDKPITLVGTKWDRQADEPELWYRRFVEFMQMSKPSILELYRRHTLKERLEAAYINLFPFDDVNASRIDPAIVDPDESIRNAVRGLAHISSTWRNAVMALRWQERYQAWQDHEADALNTLWRDRSAQFREDSYTLYLKAWQKVTDMLNIPLLSQRIETSNDANGNPVTVTIIEPAKWGFRDTAMLMGRTMELGQLSIGKYSSAINLLVTSGFDVRSPNQSIDTIGGADSDSEFSNLQSSIDELVDSPAANTGFNPDGITPEALAFVNGEREEEDEFGGEIEAVDL